MNKSDVISIYNAHGLPSHPEWYELPQDGVLALLADASVYNINHKEEVMVDVGLVISGTMGIERQTSDGRRTLVALYRQGDLIDVRRFERQRQGKLVALTPMLLAYLEVETFDMCLQSHPRIQAIAYNQMKDHLGRLRDHAADVGTKTPVERIASVLFEFCRWPGNNALRSSPFTLTLPVTKRDIADYVGLKPETVSRVFKRLQKKELILINAQNRREITLLQPPILRRIANGGAPRKPG